MSTTTATMHYYVPPKSHWPLIGSLALASMALGAVNLIQCASSKTCQVSEAGFHGFITFQSHFSLYFLTGGFLLVLYLLYGWFSNVIAENLQGLYGEQINRSFRWGMLWFIFSEVMFFAAFFGVLFYTRSFSIPWLAGEGEKEATHALLWPRFEGVWPLIQNPDPKQFPNPRVAMPPWGLPAVNTLILLTSSITVTWAHWGLLQSKRFKTILGLGVSILLGALFLYFQATEYHEAYSDMNLTLRTGIYGSTFFMLTGFHGLHVLIGTLMLTVMLVRAIKRHFTVENHFGFEAASWYWHFVDVVWLVLFIFVYCL